MYKFNRHICIFFSLKFTVGPSGKDIFVSSDMFYLEIILEDNGGVKDVKIHHDGKSEPQVQFMILLIRLQ